MMTDLRWDRIILLVGQKEVEEFLSEDIEESLQEEEKDEEIWNFDRLFVLQLIFVHRNLQN